MSKPRPRVQRATGPRLLYAMARSQRDSNPRPRHLETASMSWFNQRLLIAPIIFGLTETTQGVDERSQWEMPLFRVVCQLRNHLTDFQKNLYSRFRHRPHPTCSCQCSNSPTPREWLGTLNPLSLLERPPSCAKFQPPWGFVATPPSP